MTNSERYVKEAKNLIVKFFDDYALPCSYRTFRDLDHTYTRGFHGTKLYFSNGCFRSTCIPAGKKFVIKTAIRDSGKDQCEREVDNYFEAEAQGFGRYFAKYYGCFTFRSHTFYVFQKIENVGCGWDDYDTVMSAYAYKKGLLDFLSDYDINDYHCGNYGKCGRTYVLTDYAGCHEDDWDY